MEPWEKTDRFTFGGDRKYWIKNEVSQELPPDGAWSCEVLVVADDETAEEFWHWTFLGFESAKQAKFESQRAACAWVSLGEEPSRLLLRRTAPSRS